MEQTKIDILLSSIRTLNKTEFNENLTEENNWENILLELEMLQKTVSDQKRRSKVIIKTILECAAGDYLKKLPISSSLDTALVNNNSQEKKPVVLEETGGKNRSKKHRKNKKSKKSRKHNK